MLQKALSAAAAGNRAPGAGTNLVRRANAAMAGNYGAGGGADTNLASHVAALLAGTYVPPNATETPEQRNARLEAEEALRKVKETTNAALAGKKNYTSKNVAAFLAEHKGGYKPRKRSRTRRNTRSRRAKTRR
jgi:hypothetical protein